MFTGGGKDLATISNVKLNKQIENPGLPKNIKSTVGSGPNGMLLIFFF